MRSHYSLHSNHGVTKARLAMGILGGVVAFCGCKSVPAITTKEMTPLVSFNKAPVVEKIPVSAAIFLPDRERNSLPLLVGDDRNLWPWFFENSVAAVFREVTVVKTLDEARNNPKIGVVVTPEMWGWFLQSYYGNFVCLVELKYRILDVNGNRVTTIIANGKGQNAGVHQALAQAMEGAAQELQRGAPAESSRIVTAVRNRPK